MEFSYPTIQKKGSITIILNPFIGPYTIIKITFLFTIEKNWRSYDIDMIFKKVKKSF